MQLTLFVIVLKWNRYFLKIFKDSQFLLNNSARNFHLDQSSHVSELIDFQQPIEMLKSFANAMEEASIDFIIEKPWKSTVSMKRCLTKRIGRARLHWNFLFYNYKKYRTHQNHLRYATTENKMPQSIKTTNV